MWISKQTYDNMSDSIERLSHYQDQWNRLVYAIEHGDESCFVLDGVVVVSQQLLQANMVIAQNVTYERVEQATDVVADVYDDIMDLFKQDDQKK